MSESTTVRRAESPLDVSFSDDELAAHREHITGFIESMVAEAGAEGRSSASPAASTARSLPSSPSRRWAPTPCTAS